ncbi:MAG: rhodanese-like domain-containing protein, partial [Planctomycetota bacterium]
KVYVSDEGGPDWKYAWLDAKAAGADGHGTYDYQLLRDGEAFWIGKIEFEVIHTPGHTPEHVCFLVTDHGSGADEPVGILTGDFVFVGDLGRPDLLETAAGQAGAMEPSARQLHKSLARLRDIPDFTQVWPGHGAGSACGKALGAVPASTMGYERRFSPAMQAAGDEQGFVDFILEGQPEPPMYFAAMKHDNKHGPRVLGGLTIPPRVDAATLATVDASAQVIIDTREWESFRDAHLPGSLYIPLNAGFCTDAGSFVTADDAIWLVVEPALVERAVRALVRIGLDRIEGWCSPEDLEAAFAGGTASTSIAEVDPAEAAALLENGRARSLDVRRATEFAGGHVPGATNIAHTRLASRLDELPGDGPILVNCRSGGRSARASAYLKRAGRDVINLAGGYSAWSASPAASSQPKGSHA